MSTSGAVEIVIAAGRSRSGYWTDLWQFRELFYLLAWRDILVRYKQTSIGIAWAVIRPLLTTAVLVFVFNGVAGLSAPGAAPYPLFVFAAMLPWQFFSNSLSESGASLVNNSGLITKVYFPRLIVPASSIVTSFVDFLIMLALLILMMAWYGFAPDWRVVTLPLFIAASFVVAFGAGLVLSALNVSYRDVRYVVPFLIQFGLYVSPVGFSSTEIPERWRLVYALNPMAGIIDGFRWALLRGEPALWWPGIGGSIAAAVVLGFSGIWYFRRTERAFADVI